MATLEQLESGGQISRHDAELETWELSKRMISFTSNFGKWLSQLKSAPKKRGRTLTPFEEINQSFFAFVMGKPMAFGVDYRKLEPHGNHVWEFKTLEMRVFGWFPRKAHFLAVCGEFKDNLPNNKAYKPFIEQVIKFREALALDEPKAILGVGKDAVL
jgi:hypothetical protein